MQKTINEKGPPTYPGTHHVPDDFAGCVHYVKELRVWGFLVQERLMADSRTHNRN